MSKRIIAFTGAGISRESGIPTFEDMGDLRTKLSRDFANEHSEECQQPTTYRSGGLSVKRTSLIDKPQ